LAWLGQPSSYLGCMTASRVGNTKNPEPHSYRQMARLRLRAERTGLKLKNVNLIDISKFNTEFEIPIQKKIDNGAWETIDILKLTPDQTPGPGPEPQPEPTGDVLYDSTVNSKLHDGQTRTIPDKEGTIAPNGLGIEMHASGNPKVVVNADNTFSLICGAGHGRFYGFVLNYNATLEITCAFWNSASGQDLSLKMRSRHNESGACENRFGGYGLSIDRSGWGAKRETCHNNHDQSTSGSLPSKPETQKYFTIRHTVKDEGNGVRQIGEMDGKQFMNKIDSSPKPYMVDKASFAKQSYFWVRSNIDSGTGEIRIKKLRILKA
jgi:hypothetical protein